MSEQQQDDLKRLESTIATLRTQLSALTAEAEKLRGDGARIATPPTGLPLGATFRDDEICAAISHDWREFPKSSLAILREHTRAQVEEALAARQADRARTYKGIARQMADQWGPRRTPYNDPLMPV